MITSHRSYRYKTTEVEKEGQRYTKVKISGSQCASAFHILYHPRNPSITPTKTEHTHDSINETHSRQGKLEYTKISEYLRRETAKNTANIIKKLAIDQLLAFVPNSTTSSNTQAILQAYDRSRTVMQVISSLVTYETNRLKCQDYSNRAKEKERTPRLG